MGTYYSQKRHNRRNCKRMINPRNFGTIRFKMPKDQTEEFAKNLKKDKVNVPEIGIFEIKNISAKKGGKKAINPFTQEEYITKSKPARKKIKFRPSKKLKDRIGA